MITYKPACWQRVAHLSSRCETTRRRKRKTDNTSGECLKPGPVSKRIQNRQRRHGRKTEQHRHSLRNNLNPEDKTPRHKQSEWCTQFNAARIAQICPLGKQNKHKHRRTSTSGRDSAVHSHLKKWLSFEETMYTSWPERTGGLKEVLKKLSNSHKSSCLHIARNYTQGVYFGLEKRG